MPSLFLAFLSELLIFIILRTAQTIVAIILILFTTPTSPLRPASIPIQLLLAAAQFHTACRDGMKAFLAPTYRSVCGSTLVLQTVWVIAVPVMVKWDADTVGKDVLASRAAQGTDDANASSRVKDEETETETEREREKRALVTTKDKAQWLFDLAGNNRCIGTPYQVRGIPAWDESRPSWVPTRKQAVSIKLASFVAGYIIRDVLLTLVLGRVPIGLFYTVYYRYYLDYPAQVIGALALSLSSDGDKSVQDWPPMFGSFTDTTTVRGFWGKFWHQNLRFALTSFSNGFCKDLLGLRGLVQRYSNIFVVFTLSGIMHLVQDMVFGFSWRQSRAIVFFCGQAVAIMVEDLVQGIWRRLTEANGTGRNKRASSTPGWAKVVGWLWTWSFMTYMGNIYMAPYEENFGELYRLPFRPTELTLRFLGYGQRP